MMYFAPQLCHLERMAEAEPAEALPYFRYPLKKGDVPETGALASAYSSSSEKGEQIVAAVIPELVNICRKEMPGD